MTTSPNNGGAIQSVDVTSALPSSVRESDVDSGTEVIPELQDHLVVMLVSSQRVSWIVSGQMAHVRLVGMATNMKAMAKVRIVRLVCWTLLGLIFQRL